MYGGYGPSLNKNAYNKKENEEEEDAGPIFKILSDPNALEQLDIVWNIALQCENPKVVPKGIDFLIKVYCCLDEDMAGQRIPI